MTHIFPACYTNAYIIEACALMYPGQAIQSITRVTVPGDVDGLTLTTGDWPGDTKHVVVADAP